MVLVAVWGVGWSFVGSGGVGGGGDGGSDGCCGVGGGGGNGGVGGRCCGVGGDGGGVGGGGCDDGDGGDDGGCNDGGGGSGDDSNFLCKTRGRQRRSDIAALKRTALLRTRKWLWCKFQAKVAAGMKGGYRQRNETDHVCVCVCACV